MHFNIFKVIKHLPDEHFIFLIDIIVVVINSLDTCKDLLFEFYFSNFDFSYFNCACDDSIVRNICAEIVYVIYCDYV